MEKEIWKNHLEFSAACIFSEIACQSTTPRMLCHSALLKALQRLGSYLDCNYAFWQLIMCDDGLAVEFSECHLHSRLQRRAEYPLSKRMIEYRRRDMSIES